VEWGGGEVACGVVQVGVGGAKRTDRGGGGWVRGRRWGSRWGGGLWVVEGGVDAWGRGVGIGCGRWGKSREG